MKNNKGFWGNLELPIVGLSPMDGVTDAPMRYIAKKYGKPSVVYTEFVSAEGLWRIKKRGEMDHKIWQELRYGADEKPVVAQIFGSDPESFYEASKIVCELGFNGVDINMGCPSPGLEKRGGGAGLIRDKCNAVEVVEATRRGVNDYRKNQKDKNPEKEDIEIPVSLKTRIGSDRPDKKWWEVLAGLQMPVVAMHGRTFKQLYSGFANWDLLLEASEIIRESGALFLGNGDVKEIRSSSTEDFKVLTGSGREVDLTGKIDGILIGRGAIGNPWILDRNNFVPTTKQRLDVAVEHSEVFEKILPEQKFFVMRKHLVGYASGFADASEIRKRLVLSNSAKEVRRIVEEWLNK